MIVSLPQISVKTPPQTAGGSAMPGNFSTALAEANRNTQPMAKPPVDNQSEGNSGKTASAKAKLNAGVKSSTSPLNSLPEAQAPAANLYADDNVCVVCNPAFALLPLVPQSTVAAKPEAASNQGSAFADKPGLSAVTVLPAEAVSSPSSTAPACSTLSAPARMSASTSQPASVFTQGADQELPAAQAKAPSLAPCGNSAPADAASIPEAGAKSTVGGRKTPASAGADAEHVISNVPSAVAANAKATAVEPKPTSRETARSVGTIDPKSPAGDSSSKPQEAIGDGLQKTMVLPFPAVLPPGVKPELWPQAQPNQGVARESDSGIVPPSSEALKGDGDAAQNPPPSDKSNASSSGVVATPKPGFDNAMTQAAATPPSTVAGSAPVSALVENKPVVSNASSKSADPTPKNLGQASGAADVETPAEAPGSHISSPLETAKLMERAGKTELRVGIQAGEFGSVDIRTSMARGQFSAEISVERDELGRAMTAELPALQNRFAEQHLPPANIILQDHSHFGGSGNAGQGQRGQQYLQPTNILADDDANAAAPIVAAEALETSYGLDVHI